MPRAAHPAYPSPTASPAPRPRTQQPPPPTTRPFAGINYPAQHRRLASLPMTGSHNPGNNQPATAGGPSKPRSLRAGAAPAAAPSQSPRSPNRAGIAPERVSSGTPRSPDRAGIAPGRVSTGTPRPQGRAAAASGRQRQVTQAHSGRCSTDNEASADPSNTEPAASSGNRPHHRERLLEQRHPEHHAYSPEHYGPDNHGPEHHGPRAPRQPRPQAPRPRARPRAPSLRHPTTTPPSNHGLDRVTTDAASRPSEHPRPRHGHHRRSLALSPAARQR